MKYIVIDNEFDLNLLKEMHTKFELEQVELDVPAMRQAFEMQQTQFFVYEHNWIKRKQDGTLTKRQRKKLYDTTKPAEVGDMIYNRTDKTIFIIKSNTHIYHSIN